MPVPEIPWPQIPVAVVVAAIAATAGLVGVWLGRVLVDRDNRKDRLRAIYVEVLRTAVHLTPKELGYKLSADGVDVPRPAEIDALMARLVVEAEADAGPVRDAFLKLFNRAAIYAIDTGPKSDASSAELKQARQDVHDALHQLQTAIRSRLA